MFVVFHAEKPFLQGSAQNVVTITAIFSVLRAMRKVLD